MMNSRSSSRGSKTIGDWILEYGRALITVLGTVAVIATIATWFFGDNILRRGADVRFTATEFVSTPMGLAQAIMFSNVGQQQAEVMEIRAVYSDTIVVSSTNSLNTISPIVISQPDDKRIVDIKMDRLSPMSERAKIDLVIKGSVSTNSPQITCRHSTGQCKEANYQRPSSDFIFFISWAVLAAIFLIQNFVPSLFRRSGK